MNKYLIYTTEGYCEDPHGDEIANCQFLGRVEANDKAEAREKFFTANPRLEIRGFSRYNLQAVQLHDNEII